MTTILERAARTAILLGAAGFFATTTAQATNGYLIHGIGTRAKALAGAGVALPLDALAAGTNPAAMALVGKRYDVGVAFFSPNREFAVTGDPSGFPDTFGLQPQQVKSDSELFLIPNLGLNWEIGPDTTFGLSIYGQGGMNTDWPTNVFFGSSPTGVDLSQLFIMPTWARKFGGGKHSIGIGGIVAFQQFQVEGVEAFGFFSQDPANITNNGKDDSFGFGVKVGYLGQWTDRVSFGLAYQSQVRMDEFDKYRGLFVDNGDFDIPSNVVAGMAVKLNDKTTILFDFQRIYYSDVDSVHNPLLPNLGVALLGSAAGAGFGWQDMDVVKLGLQWESGRAWTWRFGFSTGDQPIPDSEVLFNILAPGVVEDHITLGFTKDLSGGRAWSLSLMHAPSASVTGPNPLDIPGQTIEFEMSQFDLEIGYSWGF